MKESEKKISNSTNEIVFHIHNYDAIFSDFDARSYSERALSDDFLIEAKKASYEKKEKILLRFLIPQEKRKFPIETIIKKRLNEHFKKHALQNEREKNKLIKQGVVLILLGIIFMFFATYLLSLSDRKLLINFLIVLLEPAGWFSFWEGLYLLVFKIKEKNPNLQFYEKMSKSAIIFETY